MWSPQWTGRRICWYIIHAGYIACGAILLVMVHETPPMHSPPMNPVCHVQWLRTDSTKWWYPCGMYHDYSSTTICPQLCCQQDLTASSTILSSTCIDFLADRQCCNGVPDGCLAAFHSTIDAAARIITRRRANLRNQHHLLPHLESRKDLLPGHLGRHGRLRHYLRGFPADPAFRQPPAHTGTSMRRMQSHRRC